MELTDEMLVEISFVEMSKYRKMIVKSLEDDVKIPTAIADDLGLRANHISKTLGELRDHEIVECINPEFRKGRLYRLTEKGEIIVKNMKYS